MNAFDRTLGMDRAITRRDFLNGVGLTVVGSMLAPELAHAAAQELHPSAQNPRAGDPAFAPERAADYYPPTRTGMRGSHPGSFEVAHQLRDARQWNLSGAIETDESYDLVIVGGGLSGLSAAYYFIRDAGRNAKVLVLDNHDDFGGHAKRNEFHYNGRMLALNGGTLNIESWNRYNEHARSLITEIGIDIDRFLASNQKNRTLYASALIAIRRCSGGRTDCRDSRGWISRRARKDFSPICPAVITDGRSDRAADRRCIFRTATRQSRGSSPDG